MIEYLFYDKEIARLITDSQLISVFCEGDRIPAITQITDLDLVGGLGCIYSNAKPTTHHPSSWVVWPPCTADIRRTLRELLEGQ